MIPEIISPSDNLTITQTSEQELLRRTDAVRDSMHWVYDVLANGLLRGVSSYIEIRQPNLVPFEEIREPLERMKAINKAVAGLALKAAGRQGRFDLAVYPCAATDLSTASLFSSNIVTIDSGDVTQDLGLRLQGTNLLYNLLEAKLLDGWYLSSIPKGITAFALDHYLAGTDINTFEIVGETLVNDGNQKMRVTSMRYQTADGRTINHVDFGMFLVKDGPAGAIPIQKILMDQIAMFSKNRSTVLLGKASGDDKFSAANPYYPALPINTVIVSDTELVEADLEKAGRKACDLKSAEIMLTIRELQPSPPPEKRSLFSNSEKKSDYPRFGYLFNLNGITIASLG